MTKIKGPTEAELHAMLTEARRAVKNLKDDIRTALLDGAPTGGLRDQLADAKARIGRWEAALGEFAERAAKVIAGRVAELRIKIGAEAVGRVTDTLASLQPPPSPATQTQG